MVSPDPRHPGRGQADFPLIDLSEFARPPLYVAGRRFARFSRCSRPTSGLPNAALLYAARHRNDQHLAQAEDGSLSEMGPGQRGEQGPEWAGAVWQRDGAGDAVQFHFLFLCSGIADEIERPPVPRHGADSLGGAERGRGERLKRGALRPGEGGEAAEGVFDEVEQCRRGDQAFFLEQTKRRGKHQVAGLAWGQGPKRLIGAPGCRGRGGRAVRVQIFGSANGKRPPLGAEAHRRGPRPGAPHDRLIVQRVAENDPFQGGRIGDRAARRAEQVGWQAVRGIFSPDEHAAIGGFVLRSQRRPPNAADHRHGGENARGGEEQAAGAQAERGESVAKIGFERHQGKLRRFLPKESARKKCRRRIARCDPARSRTGGEHARRASVLAELGRAVGFASLWRGELAGSAPVTCAACGAAPTVVWADGDQFCLPATNT